MRSMDDDVQKTNFKTCYGHYKFVLIQFRLTNALATFIDLMNWVCRPMLDRSVIVFIGDTLVYSNTKEQHEDNL